MTLMPPIASASNVLFSSATSMLVWCTDICHIWPCIFGDIDGCKTEVFCPFIVLIVTIHYYHWCTLFSCVKNSFHPKSYDVALFSSYGSFTLIIKLRVILIIIYLFVTCRTWSFFIPVTVLSNVSTYKAFTISLIHSSGRSICLFISTVSWYLLVNFWFDAYLFFIKARYTSNFNDR